MAQVEAEEETKPAKQPAKARPAASFPGQHEGETVQLVFHRHPIVMRKALLIGAFVLLAGVLPLQFFPEHYNGAMKIFLYVSLGVLAYWFYNWIGWFYSVYIVTNERLVEIKQKGFFNRKVTEFGLDKVQNVNYHVKGFQAVIFQFGDITAQTYVGDLVMSYIYKPVKIHQQIVDIVRTVNAAEPPGHILRGE